jgi:hypothetical protein
MNRINSFVLEVEDSASDLLHNLALLTGLGERSLASAPA